MGKPWLSMTVPTIEPVEDWPQTWPAHKSKKAVSKLNANLRMI
jgi:hypothetical protein